MPLLVCKTVPTAHKKANNNLLNKFIHSQITYPRLLKPQSINDRLLKNSSSQKIFVAAKSDNEKALKTPVRNKKCSVI